MNGLYFRLAWKYLIPRRGSLAASISSLLAVGVISLIVWLIALFFSITSGIENNWLSKLTALHAPVRIAPTADYFASYYAQVDTHSAKSKFSPQTLGEKREAPWSDPYDPEMDPELPEGFPLKEGENPIQTLFSLLEKLPGEGISFEDYEMGGALFRIKLPNGSLLSQMSYLLSIPEKNPKLGEILLREEGESFSSLEKKEIPSIFLPKIYRDSGIRVGSIGELCYMASTGVSTQEQRLPIEVKGFYDPGIIGVGAKCLLVPKEITRAIYKASHTFSPDGTPTNGVFFWCPKIQESAHWRDLIETKLKEEGIDRFFQVATFAEFESARELLAQFESDKLLLLLIALLLLIVGSSSLFSFLSLLVYQKRGEIGALRAIGASKKGILLLFAFGGFLIGLISALIGLILARITLASLTEIIALLSHLQGKQPLHSPILGTLGSYPMSGEWALFILIATPCIATLAALFPASQAMKMNPSYALRNE